jgi:hypothetical protein
LVEGGDPFFLLLSFCSDYRRERKSQHNGLSSARSRRAGGRPDTVAQAPLQRHALEQREWRSSRQHERGQLDTVLIAGKLMKRNGQMVGVDYDKMAKLVEGRATTL